MMDKLLVSPFLFLIALFCSAQEETPKAGHDKVAFEKVSFPFEGEVTATRLNVRMFPSTGAKSTIATVLKGGAKVTVVGEKNGFYRILPPAGCSVWIFAKNIERQGKTGTVLNNNTPVRLDSRINAKQIATLASGETVHVLKEHMGWLRIQAPESVPYFVGAKYIRSLRNLPKETAEPVASGADTEALAKIDEAQELLKIQEVLLDQREVKSLDYRLVIQAYEQALQLAQSDLVRAQAQAGIQRYMKLQRSIDMFNAKVRETKSLIDDMRIAKTTAEKKPSFVYSGYIHTVGFLYKRPGAFRLVMGGKKLCFLKAVTVEIENKLKLYYKEYVGITGKVVKDPDGWPGHTLVLVEDVVPLTKPNP